MNPAVTTCPDTSSSAEPGGRPVPTAAICPAAIATSRTASRPDSGSITRPPRSTRSHSLAEASTAAVSPMAVSLARPGPQGQGAHGGRAAGGQMASGGTLPRDATRTETVTGVVVVAHGGQSSSTEPTNALQPAVLRMIPVAAAVRQALRRSGAVVLRPRFRVRGWNGAQASPAADLHE